jgi:hypothetical protein
MMSGFSMGVSLGSMASQAFGPLAAQKTLEQGLQKAGQQAIEKAAKEAGKSVTEFAKTTSKETLQSIAKQGMTEVAKASGKTIAQGTIDSVSKTVAGTAVASVDLGAKIANAVTTFAKGLLTGTNTVAKLALGMASSKAMSNAMTAYAKSEAEWVSHDTKVCTDGS